MSYTTNGSLIRETDEAILIDSDELSEQIWIPLSQVDRITRQPKSNAVEVTMTDWIAEKKGFTQYVQRTLRS